MTAQRMNNNTIAVAVLARNETLMKHTVEKLQSRALHPENLKIYVVLDGFDAGYNKEIDEIREYANHSGVFIIEHDVPRGVRSSFNEVAAVAGARYVLKVDAHVEFSTAYDVEFVDAVEILGEQTMVIPRVCGIDGKTFEVGGRHFDYFSVDPNLHQKHWFEYENRVVSNTPYVQTMSNMGACWFCSTHYWWYLGGHNEQFYTWGESGPETSLKVWLSGGKHVLCKNIVYYHVFRNKFPYKISSGGIQKNKLSMMDYFWGGKFNRQINDVEWLVNKFWPVPGWENGLEFYRNKYKTMVESGVLESLL